MKQHELIDKLKTLSTTHFCDVSPAVRVFEPQIQRFSNPCLWAGRALTIKSEGDILPIIQAIEQATEGDVLVVAGSTHLALAGEILLTAAKHKAIAGIVIDGYCRDIDAIHGLSVPFYARGIYPAACAKLKLGQLNQTITCGNISVSPQDIIIGDDSGLIAMSETEFETLLPQALAIKAREIRALERLNQGETLSEIFNLDEHIDNLKNNKTSVLKWL